MEANRKSIFPWQAGVSYAISRKLEVGLVASKARVKDEGRYATSPGQPPSPDDDKVIARKTTNYYSVLPFINVNWKNSEKIQVYSGYAQGWGYRKTEEWSISGGCKTIHIEAWPSR
ncbi:hypothetical protein [Rufibacter sp. XAAS-G3-1]|uniref:hypothetical protein n=1 Tax=Rufibacter sp. XAAS-G3-1 TaxID=2729134 RepID=UPI0015E698C2|nr:hypothetical protein [Rufibacter sp. XAAS-G3-1]